jgi:erythromycin esterase-like protein
VIQAVRALDGSDRDFDALLQLIGDAPFVLLGEASHGTHEFYRARARITKRLIAERGFAGVCVEGDWPDAYRVNRYVRGANDDAQASEALKNFTRFPTWMWRNAEVLDFVEWLREYNDNLPAGGSCKAGFYGLDLYSLFASIDAVLTYLDRVDPKAARLARERYDCLSPYEHRTENYAYAIFRGQQSCRDEVLTQLREIQQHAASYAKTDGVAAEDEYFYAEQNARVVAEAENYYRTMLDEDTSSWNLRDTHMVETLERLTQHIARTTGRSKMIVWAHNSHIGDASATSMGRRGEINVGSLMRRRHGRNAVLVGFTTYAGTVAAASEWHRPEERKRVREARPDSYEGFFHDLGVPAFYLPLVPHRPHLPGLPDSLLERAIGVVYKPETELVSHYFRADILQQFDAVFHYDKTRAVEPLERSALWEAGEVPETYPSGV